MPETRRSLVGQVWDVREHSIAIEFNDGRALEAALERGDVACVLAEPVMTNCGMVLPRPGYLALMRGDRLGLSSIVKCRYSAFLSLARSIHSR